MKFKVEYIPKDHDNFLIIDANNEDEALEIMLEKIDDSDLLSDLHGATIGDIEEWEDPIF